jgi:cytochrome c oxidase subunit 1
MTEAKSHHPEPSYLVDTGKYKGLMAWLTTTDHKRIGLMYMYSMMVFFIVGVLLGVLMRIELFYPGQQIYGPQAYNGFFTIHGIIMIFTVVIPGLAAVFGNIIMPIMIGAKDVAFPRLNLFSFYLFILGAAIAVASQFMGNGPPDTGWTFYAPYSIQTNTNVVAAVFGAFVLGFSSILTGLNFIVTMHRLRAPGMTFFKMPLFPWSLYATAWIQVLATPIVGITLIMIIAERWLRIGFFDPALGGDPILYQHLFWIYSHPAVYIMILPAMGVVTEIIPTFAQRRIFGYKAIAISSLAIALVGYFVWAHHMYTSGMSTTARWVFSLLTFLVAVPSAIKVFNWVSTMYKGSIQMAPPFLFAVGFIFLFMIGGMTGLSLGALATNIHVHDTAYVVAHFHYIVFGGVGFSFFAAVYYWYPKMYGRMYSFKMANWSFVFLFAGFNLLYFPQFIIGMMGMPRRYFDYLPQFTFGHQLSFFGGVLLVIGFIIMLITLFSKKGAKAPDNPWGGRTFEWTIPSPPPVENFDVMPEMGENETPYDYK